MSVRKDEEFWSLASYIKRSSQRKKVLEAMKTKEVSMPSEIKEEVEMHQSHVSRALKQLEEKDLVRLMNPGDKTGRIYQPTPKAKEILKLIEE